MLGGIEGRRRRGQDEMVGWHHQFDGHEFEQTPGDGEGQGSLACCSPWGCKESDTTEWLNWTELNWYPLSCWYYLTISPSAGPFSFCFQSFPASGSFPMSQLFPIRWPKYWSFSFSISSSNAYSGFVSFRFDWFDPLAVQGILKSLLQHHSSKA